MDRQETKPMVLARIPDIDAVSERTSRRLPASSGRVIGQALSFKLLAVAVLLLVALAIVRTTLNKNAPPPDPPTVADASPAWNPGPSAPLAAAAPACTAPLVKGSAPTPASPSPMPRVLPQPKVVSTPPVPTPTDTPLMSSWPNPAYPTSSPETGGQQPQTGVNQAMAIRPPEQLRNSYDRTGSGVH